MILKVITIIILRPQPAAILNPEWHKHSGRLKMAVCASLLCCVVSLGVCVCVNNLRKRWSKH